VEDHIDAFHRAGEAIPVAHVADQEPDIRPIAVVLTLVELLGLIPAEDSNDLRFESKQVIDEPGSDRPRTSGDEDAPAAVAFGRRYLRLLDPGRGRPPRPALAVSADGRA